jgi:Uri superfamily endonuclease
MTNYQNGKIYKITGGGQTYYGSTVQTLERRMYRHRGKRNCTARLIIDLPDCKSEIIEYYPCNSKAELELREGWYIRNNACVNYQIAGRTRAEYYQDNSEKRKIYLDATRDRRLKNMLEYCENNKEEIAKQRSEYRKANREQINKRGKQYNEDHRESIQKHREDNKEYTSQYDKWRRSSLGILARNYF